MAMLVGGAVGYVSTVSDSGGSTYVTQANDYGGLAVADFTEAVFTSQAAKTSTSLTITNNHSTQMSACIHTYKGATSGGFNYPGNAFIWGYTANPADNSFTGKAAHSVGLSFFQVSQAVTTTAVAGSTNSTMLGSITTTTGRIFHIAILESFSDGPPPNGRVGAVAQFSPVPSQWSGQTLEVFP